MITCEHCGKVYLSNVTPLHCRCGGITGFTPQLLSPEYNHWAPLHYYAVKHRDNWDRVKAYLWYWSEWVPNIPKSCGCKEKWIDLYLEPDFTSPETFFAWANQAHNQINVELGKTLQPTLEEARQIWGFQ